MKLKIAVLEGDGIGPEIMKQGVAVLDAIAEKFGHEFIYHPAICGAHAIEEVGGDSLKGKGKLLTPAGRELGFEASVSFDGDEMSGYLKIAIANIKIKNGRRIG